MSYINDCVTATTSYIPHPNTGYYVRFTGPLGKLNKVDLVPCCDQNSTTTMSSTYPTLNSYIPPSTVLYIPYPNSSTNVTQ